jgi:hypothetical protein
VESTGDDGVTIMAPTREIKSGSAVDVVEDGSLPVSD